MNDSNPVATDASSANTSNLGTVGPQQAVSPTDGQNAKPSVLRRQRAVVEIGRRAATLPDAARLLPDAAALLAEVLDTEQYLVVEPAADGQLLRARLTFRAAATGNSPGMAKKTIPPGDASLAGHVLETAGPVAVHNLAREKLFSDAFLSEHHVRSALAVPLMAAGRVFGVLAVCTSRSRRFDDEDILFAETIAQMVVATIVRTEAESTANDLRRYTSGVLQTIETLVLTLDAQWRIQGINPAAQRATGLSLEDVKNSTLWDTFPIPNESAVLADLTRRLGDGTAASGYEFELTAKDSSRLMVRWSYRALTKPDGTLEAILATGVDVTRQRTKEPEHEATAAPSDPSRQGAPASKPFAPLPLPPNAERRESPRRAYPYRQWIAPMKAGQLPKLHEFKEILCHDIAAGGFSYLTAERPTTDTIVACLGIPPKVTYMLTHIAHITQISSEGPHKFLVGCAYTGRADY